MKLVPMNSIFGIRCFYFFSFSFHLNLHLNCSINSDFFPFFLYFRNAEVELVFFYGPQTIYDIFQSNSKKLSIFQLLYTSCTFSRSYF